jgi:MSHA pilin protein MshC
MNDSENATAHQKVNLPQRIRRVVSASPGFTLIELIMVIVLIGILAVSIMPKFVDTSAISLHGGAAMIAADIRYAQELAMSTNQPKSITFTNGVSSYDTVDGRTINLPSNVSILTGATFNFNTLGKPTAGGLVTISAGGPTKTINVESDTGNVSIS